MTSSKLAVWVGILAGMQAIAGAATLPDLLPAPVAGWIQLLVGAAGIGTAVFIRLSPAVTLPGDRPPLK